MLVRIFTLKFDPIVAGFDDSDLRDFIKDKEVLSIRDHFFIRDEAPYLAVVVTYNPPQVEKGKKNVRERREEDREKWRQILEEGDWPIFNSLRDWRNDLARAEGVPPYVICTNRQLAEIAHRRPESLSKLSAIEGMGKTKLKRYGKAILEAVGSEREEAEAEDAGAGEE